MSRAAAARLAVFVIAAAAALAVLWWTHSLGWFALACSGALLTDIPSQRLFDRLATPDERRADLEDRVRNPPS